MTRLALFLMVVFFLLFVPTGCDEDCPTFPECISVEIAGRITGAGHPLRARISPKCVRRACDFECSGLIRDTESDSTGHYSVSLLPGDYVLMVRLEDSYTMGYVKDGSLSYTEADTFAVRTESDAIVVDVSLGAVRLDLQTPPELDGWRATVYLRSPEGSGHAYATEEVADGHVSLASPAVIPGRYRMYLVVAHTGFWLPGSYSEEEGELIFVTAGEETFHEEEIPSRGMLSGSVTGSWQQLSLRRPQLRLFDADSTQISWLLATWEGEYQMWVFVPVRARLAIRIDGYPAYWRWHGGDSFDEAAVFDLQPGETIELDIVESGIAGDFVPSGIDAVGTNVYLHDGDGSQLARTYVRDEMFRFANLLPGTYYIRFDEGASWISHWYDSVDSFDEATPIDIVTEGEVVWIEPTPLEGGSISGRVLDPHGEPIFHALALTTSLESSEDWQGETSRTRVGGEFRIAALPNGSYKLGAGTDARGWIWYPGVANWDSAGVITIEDYEKLTGIVLQFEK